MKKKNLKSEINGMLNGLFGKDTAKSIMEANFKENEGLPRGERVYLTVAEFVAEGMVANDIIILTKKDDRYRCHCKTPVRDLKFKNGRLEWSDENGDPHHEGLKPTDTLIDEEYCGNYSTTIFRIKKKKAVKKIVKKAVAKAVKKKAVKK